MCARLSSSFFFSIWVFQSRLEKRISLSVCVFDSLLLLDDETFVLSERVIAREREREEFKIEIKKGEM